MSARHPERFRLVAIAANTNAAKLARQVLAFPPTVRCARRCVRGGGTYARCWAARHPAPVCAGGPARSRICRAARGALRRWRPSVGAAGLRSTPRRSRSGKRLLLANKESLRSWGPAARRGQCCRARCCRRSTASTTPSSSACRRALRAGRDPTGPRASAAAHRLRRTRSRDTRAAPESGTPEAAVRASEPG